LARRLWPDSDALGESIIVGGDGVRRQIIGIVRDGKYITLSEPARGYVLAPLTQMYSGPLTLHVRAQSTAGRTADPALLVPAVRRVLQELDSTLPIFEV